MRIYSQVALYAYRRPAQSNSARVTDRALCHVTPTHICEPARITRNCKPTPRRGASGTCTGVARRLRACRQIKKGRSNIEQPPAVDKVPAAGQMHRFKPAMKLRMDDASNTFDITDIMAWFADAICRYCKFSQAGSMCNTLSVN